MSTSSGPVAPVLSLQGVAKRFGVVQALRDVSVECLAGEVHAVLGENGSGKSTLLGIASGVLAPDRGTVEIAGRPLHHASPAEAHRLGLAEAYQTMSHILEFTVAENLFLAAPAAERPPLRGVLAWAAEKLAEFETDMEPSARVSDLPLGKRQLLEVVKALLGRPKVLLLDEPTAALGPAEVAHLHQLIRARAEAGVGVVYVSHRLPEVIGIADRITVLRDGVSQGTSDAAGITADHLVGLMIGRPLDLAFPARDQESSRGPVVLSVAALRGPGLGPIDLDLHSGEILGIAAAAGNGQDELLRCIAGAERGSGTIRCDGVAVKPTTPHAGLKAGIVFLSGDRAREALFPVLGVRGNATIQVLRRFSRLGIIRRRKEGAAVGRLVDVHKVRTPSIAQPVRFLSGGNQQKVALMRPFLRGDIKVILAQEPTQGVDAASRLDIYEALRTKASEGVGIIVDSSDPIELSGLCDRVLVLSRGRVVGEIPAEELGERRIVEAIVGREATSDDRHDDAIGNGAP